LGQSTKKIRVVVVDDSAFMRLALTRLIDQANDMEVVGTAGNAASAAVQITRLAPDVVTLDIEMPGVSGLDFLERLMQQNQTLPVIMISSYTERNSETTLRALELGAVDFVTKPAGRTGEAFEAQAEEIREKIRAAKLSKRNDAGRNSRSGGERKIESASVDVAMQHERIIFIGASTGGTEAIKEVLTHLPAEMPPILVVQHMPEMFTGSFAKRLDNLCALRVKEAEDGDRILPGHAYIAPGHSHLAVRRSGAGFQCELLQSEPVNRHRPSVEVLFASAAKIVGPNAIGVMLTGMGKDGAQGMLAMRRAGAWNIGQDQDSCVVYGMPREAAIIGALDEVAPLGEVSQRILARLRQGTLRVSN